MANDEKTELNLNHDELIERVERFNGQDARRASDAGETRAAIGLFLEQSGLHPKAFSFARMVLKQKKETQRLDIIASMELILPMLANHVRGQTPQLPLDDHAEAPEAVEFQDEETEKFAADVDAAEAGEVVPFGEEDAA